MTSCVSLYKSISSCLNSFESNPINTNSALSLQDNANRSALKAAVQRSYYTTARNMNADVIDSTIQAARLGMKSRIKSCELSNLSHTFEMICCKWKCTSSSRNTGMALLSRSGGECLSASGYIVPAAFMGLWVILILWLLLCWLEFLMGKE